VLKIGRRKKEGKSYNTRGSKLTGGGEGGRPGHSKIGFGREGKKRGEVVGPRTKRVTTGALKPLGGNAIKGLRGKDENWYTTN